MPRVLPPSGRQRRWTLALIAMLVVLGSGLLFFLLYLNAGDRVPVLSIAREVGQGEEITRDDLAEVRVSADPTLDLVPANDIDDVVGQPAAVDLAVGSLLTESQIGEPIGLEPGTTVVGVRVGTPAMPFASIRRGMVVDVIFTPEPSDKSEFPENGEILARGTIYSIEETTETGILHVGVLLDQEVGVAVATAAHNNVVALALVGSGELLTPPPTADDAETSESTTSTTEP
jgi:hypothetical protein